MSNCKYIKTDGSSCGLNKNCKYPNCLDSQQDILTQLYEIVNGNETVNKLSDNE